MSMRERARSAGAQTVEKAKPERAMPARLPEAAEHARTCPLRGRADGGKGETRAGDARAPDKPGGAMSAAVVGPASAGCSSVHGCTPPESGSAGGRRAAPRVRQ